MNDRARAKKTLAYFERRKSAMIRFLETLVLIQSGTRNKAGVDRVGRVIAGKMAAVGFTVTVVENEEFGNHLVARSGSGRGISRDNPQILMVGHMDTVFPENTHFNWFRQDKDRCYGPGVIDMKGGLAVGVFALQYLFDHGLLGDVPFTFVFNSDEEIGSPSSRRLIREEAGKSRAGFVFEAGGPGGRVVTGRKGNISARIDVRGKAGHAAFAGEDKASAILEMAHKTIAIEAMNRPEKGISANVGTVEGGIGPNTVPECAGARIDVRYQNSGEEEAVMERLSAITGSSRVNGTASSLNLVSRRPPMDRTPGNLELFDRIRKIASTLDIPVASEVRRGVSDANLISAAGIPVIDGLGPVGEKDHSEDEYMVTESLIQRAALFSHVAMEFIREAARQDGPG